MMCTEQHMLMDLDTNTMNAALTFARTCACAATIATHDLVTLSRKHSIMRYVSGRSQPIRLPNSRAYSLGRQNGLMMANGLKSLPSINIA